jgi:hypothetical protein
VAEDLSFIARKDAEAQRRILCGLASLRELIFFLTSSEVEEYLTS